VIKIKVLSSKSRKIINKNINSIDSIRSTIFINYDIYQKYYPVIFKQQHIPQSQVKIINKNINKIDSIPNHDNLQSHVKSKTKI